MEGIYTDMNLNTAFGGYYSPLSQNISAAGAIQDRIRAHPFHPRTA
jgi:hypothetical protein